MKRCVGLHRHRTRVTPRLPAQPHQVTTAHPFEDGEGDRRCHQQRTDTQHGQRGVTQAPNRTTQTKRHAFAPSLADAKTQHH